ncbi:UTP--glucose-1-phosphate uridylyltransferase [Evansella halocellulosilytica]|uniref:UTP--glucose-1-phosphate uridylyltransferase n=1 Tax=Evansella halocellulosilytica TaxID=2011013 RepID=UPI000BB77A4C|nr:UTP--glucose-1-phosphate uridylyltransferase [Evansella halocellulosilytica]
MIKKAIIPAAGYGTRNLPITKVLPKEMFPIAGKPAIHYIVEEAVSSGVEEILIVVSRNKNMILDYFDRSIELETFLELKNKQHLLNKLDFKDVHIQYVRQAFANGLGDAILQGELFTKDEPFAVLLPDDLFSVQNRTALSQLIESFELTKSTTIAVQEVKQEELHQYGVIKANQVNNHVSKILDIIEKPKTSPPSNLAVCGRYVFTPSIYKHLKNLSPSIGGEIQLTDAIQYILSDEGCFGVQIEGKRYDIGKEEDYFQLINEMHNYDEIN